jgi:hypothetical protein
MKEEVCLAFTARGKRNETVETGGKYCKLLGQKKSGLRWAYWENDEASFFSDKKT